MEVCVGQNHSIIKYGIDQLLPEQINFTHGCPVCVTPLTYIGNGHQPGSGFTERRAVAQDLLTACPYA